MGAIPNSKTYLQVITEALTMKREVKYFKPSPKENGLTISTDMIRSLVLDNNVEPPHAKAPFYVLDLGVLAGLMDRWAHSLPEFRPFYAVKCNPHPDFLAAMAALGSNFDCATRAEIESVLALGVSPDRIVFANPCKLESHIDYAASVGVNLTTYDSEAELHKIRKWHPKCSLLLRIKSPEDGGARRALGSKYGALPEEVEPLLAAAESAGLPVIGVSFHVGSAATNANAYAAAIAAARAAFDAAARLGMAPMRVLDVGGGFFAFGEAFEEAASAIKSAVEEHFPPAMRPLGFSLIAEPGRFFAETAFTLAARIVGKRVRREAREYWINDGIYGSLMGCVILGAGNGNLTCTPLALHACKSGMSRARAVPAEVTSFEVDEFDSTVFGPTCDSLDMVLRGYRLPELEVGDWLVFPNMGAYSSVFKSNFNGLNTSPFRIYLVASHSQSDIQ